MRRSLKSVNPSRPPAQIFINGFSATLTACGELVAASPNFHLSSRRRCFTTSTSRDDFPEAPGQSGLRLSRITLLPLLSPPDVPGTVEALRRSSVIDLSLPPGATREFSSCHLGCREDLLRPFGITTPHVLLQGKGLPLHCVQRGHARIVDRGLHTQTCQSPVAYHRAILVRGAHHPFFRLCSHRTVRCVHQGPPRLSQVQSEGFHGVGDDESWRHAARNCQPKWLV
jgi:hypothetical protein